MERTPPDGSRRPDMAEIALQHLAITHVQIVV